MNKIKWKGSTLLAPVPCVMVSLGSMEKPNIITIGWTGIINSAPPKTYISVRPERHSYEILKKTGKFVINLTSENLVRSADFCGVRSGLNTDKFAACHLTPVPAYELPDLPMIDEAPISIECKVTDIIPLGSHDMFLADIVSVNVCPELIDEKGALKMSKAHLIAYSHGDYMALGKKLGSFGYSVKKKRNKNRQYKK